MPDAVIGALRVTLGLDSAAFEKGLEKSRGATARGTKAISGDFSKMQRSLDGVTKALSASFATLGAGLAIGGISSAISTGLEYASSLGEVAQQLGVSTRALQEYRFVATQTGIEQGVLDNGLGKLTRSIGEAANGARAQTDAFAALGVSIRDQNGHLKTTDQILPELIAAFSRIPEPTRRAALETDLFGKAGQKLDTLLAGGVGQVNNLRDAANKLGIVLSSEQIQKADDTADRLASLQQVLTAQISAQVANNADSILALANAFGTLTTNIGGTLVALQDYRNLQAFKNGDIAAGRRLLGSKSGRANLENLYDEQLAANSKARSAGGLSAAEKARLDAEFKKIVARRNYAMALDRRAAQSPKAAPAPISGGGGGGGVRIPRAARALRASGARASSSASGLDLGEQTRSIVDGLFPREAELRKLNESMAMLGAALGKELISLPDFQRASTALQERIGAVTAEIAQVARDAAFPDLKLNMNPDLFAAGKSFDDLTIGLSKFGKAANDNAETQMRTTDQIVASYADMAQGVLGSLQGLTSSIKGGDFLDILGGVIGLLTQLGSIGLFGKGVAANINLPNIPARAKGGPVRAGTTYLVGERGPELFRPSAGGSIIPNGQFGGAGGGLTVQVVKGDLFDVIVQGHVVNGIKAAAPGIAANSAVAANANRQREQDRRLA